MQLMLMTLIMSFTHLRGALFGPMVTSEAHVRIHPAVYEAQVRIVSAELLVMGDTLQV
jgi:hypothetical protein